MNSYPRLLSHATTIYTLLMDVHVRQILKHADINREDYILDVGCDEGVLVDRIGRYSDHVYGLDTNKAAIDVGTARNVQNLGVASAYDLPFKDETFDLLLSVHTIEHLEDLKKAFDEFNRVLKVGGRQVLIYPWEPIKGITCFPHMNRHKHKLNPRKLEVMVGKRNAFSCIYLSPQPTFFSVFQKDGSARY